MCGIELILLVAAGVAAAQGALQAIADDRKAQAERRRVEGRRKRVPRLPGRSSTEEGSDHDR